MTHSELKTRASLVERLRNRDDKDSWREFFDRYWKLIYGLAIKSGLTEDESEEVVQETMATLAKNMDGYEYKPKECSFKSWIFNAAKWRIIDQVRKRPPDLLNAARSEPHSDRTATVERVADNASWDFDRLWDEEWQENLMDVALNRVRQTASIKDFQIFDLYVLKKHSVAEVKKLLRVSAAHVYVAKHRVALLFKREIKKLESEMSK